MYTCIYTYIFLTQLSARRTIKLIEQTTAYSCRPFGL